MAKVTTDEELLKVQYDVNELAKMIGVVVLQAQRKDWKRVASGLALLANDAVHLCEYVDKVVRTDSRPKRPASEPTKDV